MCQVCVILARAPDSEKFVLSTDHFPHYFVIIISYGIAREERENYACVAITLCQQVPVACD